MIPNVSRELEWLLNQDADVLVDILHISSEDIIEAFEDKVIDYLEDREYVEDEEAGVD
jgi:hypothetical protein